jgi:hypothetical protein
MKKLFIMKYLFFMLFILIALFVYIPSAQAQVSTTPTIFFCVGDNLQPPCADVSPSPTIQPSQTPITLSPPNPTVSVSPPNPTISISPPNPTISTSPSVTTAQPTTAQPTPENPTPTPPCQSTAYSISSQNAGNAPIQPLNNIKKHESTQEGLLQQFVQFLLELFLLFFQQLGLQLPTSPIPCPSPTPAV